MYVLFLQLEVKTQALSYKRITRMDSVVGAATPKTSCPFFITLKPIKTALPTTTTSAIITHTNANRNESELPRLNASLVPKITPPSRRDVVVFSVSSLIPITSLNCSLMISGAQAEEASSKEEEKDEGIIGAVKSLFDPNEKTKSGKVLPKAYLKSAREVVKTLRESLKEDPKDVAKFRRSADAAKESIREYLGAWRGQEKVVREESYVELEKAFRYLASFYSKAGPSAPISEEVKTEILKDLDAAEEFL